MYKRQVQLAAQAEGPGEEANPVAAHTRSIAAKLRAQGMACLLYTSDAADERSSVDLGGRRIIKKKKNTIPRRVDKVSCNHEDKRTHVNTGTI